MELVLIIAIYLASIFLIAFMESTDVTPKQDTIEDIIARHGVIVSLADCDFSEEDKLLEPILTCDYEEDYLLPKHRPISVGRIKSERHEYPRQWSASYSMAAVTKRCHGQQPKYKNREWSRKYKH